MVRCDDLVRMNHWQGSFPQVSVPSFQDFFFLLIFLSGENFSEKDFFAGF